MSSRPILWLWWLCVAAAVAISVTQADRPAPPPERETQVARLVPARTPVDLNPCASDACW